MWNRRRMPSYRPWGSTEDGAIEFESLTEETLDGAIGVMRRSFFPYESACRGIDLVAELGSSTELEKLCWDSAKDGVSIVAVDVKTTDVVGVCFNKIQVLPNSTDKTYFELFSENCKCEASKALIDFMSNVDARVNLFKLYNVNCILEIMFLATLPEYGQRRIGELLVSSSLELAKELRRGKNVKMRVMMNGDDTIRNFDRAPDLASAIMTSIYSQKISVKLGFERLIEVSYDEFEFNGKKFSERLGPENPVTTLVAKRILP